MKPRLVWHIVKFGLLLIFFGLLVACSSEESIQPTPSTDSDSTTLPAIPTTTDPTLEIETTLPVPTETVTLNDTDSSATIPPTAATTTTPEVETTPPVSTQTVTLNELTSYVISERSGLNHIAWSPTEMKLATIQVGQVDIWQISFADNEWHNLQSWPVDTENLMQNVVWTQDGRYLLASSNNNVWMWDTDSGKLLRELPHEYGARSFTWSPDNTILATSSNDGYIRLWDTSNWEIQNTLFSIQDAIRDVAWSPDGQFIAAPEQSVVHLWDAASGELLRTLTGHTDFVGDVYWSPDSQWLASNSNDQTILIWEPNTGSIVQTLSHKNAVFISDWSPKGNLIASGDLSGIIYLWNPDTGQSIVKVQGHDGSISDLSWSYDGTMLASTNFDSDASVLKIWQIRGEN